MANLSKERSYLRWICDLNADMSNFIPKTKEQCLGVIIGTKNLTFTIAQEKIIKLNSCIEEIF